MKRAYLIVALVLLVIEIVIALFVRDAFVRPYLGDVLAVALVYAALRAASPLTILQALALTLAIAFAIEIAQALNFLDVIGLRDNIIARTILGGVFDWSDLIAYTAGAILIAAIEHARKLRERVSR